MANKKYDKEEGVWRTIGGRRVFIRTGQSLTDAMKESGKFKTATRHEVQQAKAEKKIEQLGKENEEIWKKTNKFDDSWYDKNGKLTKEGENLYNKREKNAEEIKILEQFNRDYEPRVWEDDRYNNPKEAENTNDLVGKHVDKVQQKYEEEFGNKGEGLGYSQKQNKLSEKWEYDLYKRAKENPDSIDPMTENSTDWEALDSKYKDRYGKEKTTDWREQVKKNNELMEKELAEYKRTHDISRESDNYYEIFRNNERRNAKIKQEVPTEPYEYVEAYAGYRDKSYKLAGTKMSGKDVVEYGTKSWTGKEYTNDEFMEHLEDSNWHSERKALLEAGLTNQELAYIKDRTTLSQWSVGEELTGSKNVEKMIKEAKNHFASGSNNLMNRYSGTVDYLKQTTNMSGAEILELLKKIENDKK